MQRHAACALLSILVFTACAQRQNGEIVFEDEALPPEATVALESAMTTVAAFDERGTVRFFDSRTFSADLGLVPPSLGGPYDLDVASSWHVAVLSRDEEDQSAELTVWPRAGAVFGRPLVSSRYEGETYAAAFAGGALVFQDDMGQRWHVASPVGFVPSRPCPLPRSILAIEALSDGGYVARALASEEGALEIVEVTFDDHSLSACERTGLAAGFVPSERGRGAAIPGVGDLIADLVEGSLFVGVVGSSHHAEIPFSSTTVEAVMPFVDPSADPPRAGAVVLGAGPAALAVLTLGEGGEVEASVTAPLDGEVSPSSRFASRALAVAETRIFVATGAGLRALDISTDPLAVRLVDLPPSIAALRGPLSVNRVGGDEDAHRPREADR